MEKQTGSLMFGSHKKSFRQQTAFIFSIIFHTVVLIAISFTPTFRNILKEQTVAMDMLTAPSDMPPSVRSTPEKKQKLTKKELMNETTSIAQNNDLSEKTDTQRSENEDETQQNAASQSFSQSTSDTKTMYISTIYRLIDEKKRYPREARIQKQTGPVEISFTVLSNGAIENIQISKPAPFESLNEAALRAVQQVGRVASIPSELQTERLEISLTILFNLN